MAGSTGPDIITNGLVMKFDVSNPKSYISGSSTIYGIVGYNVPATINVNTSYVDTDGGALNIDEYPSQFTILATNTANLNLESAYTWEFCIRYASSERGNNDADADGGLIDGMIRYGTNYFHNGIMIRDSGVDTPARQIRFTYEPSGQTTRIDTYHTLNTLVYSGSMLNIAVTYDGQYAKMYQDGVQCGTTVNIGSYNTSTSVRNTRIGIWGGNYHLNGDYYYFAAYNRALSPQEVLQNYNQTKSRFI